jgi:hypothetical protein
MLTSNSNVPYFLIQYLDGRAQASVDYDHRYEGVPFDLLSLDGFSATTLS